MTGVLGSDVSAPPVWFTELFAHRRWIRRTAPFPHVYARDVFAADFHRRLTEEYGRVRRERADRFRRATPGYSAEVITLAELADGPFALFATREWHDLVARVAGVNATGDIEGSIHRHGPDADKGWPHSDLSPAWFGGEAPGPAQVRLPDDAVDVRSGSRAEGVAARETVRAVAVMFYLGNPDWKAGDGGETALYAHAGGKPAQLIPPLDNSLVLFECTPRSWHAFAGRNTAERSSVVMWLHRPAEEAAQRWGGDRIVQW